MYLFKDPAWQEICSAVQASPEMGECFGGGRKYILFFPINMIPATTVIYNAGMSYLGMAATHILKSLLPLGGGREVSIRGAVY